jgi:hypothetical protein
MERVDRLRRPEAGEPRAVPRLGRFACAVAEPSKLFRRVFLYAHQQVESFVRHAPDK